MRRFAACFGVILACLVARQSCAHELWQLTTDLWGNPLYQSLQFDRDGDGIEGTLDGDAIRGEQYGDVLKFSTTDASQAPYHFRATISGDAMTGNVDAPDTTNAAARVAHAFSARRIPARPEGAARRYEFTPTHYSNEFSPHRKPVLTIWPGDSVQTTTVDSGGVDKDGVTRALYGNPQTGPFFVVGANPGDTLAITLLRIRPNRDSADSLDAIVGRAIGTSLAAEAGGLGKPVRWTLDRERGLARPAEQGGKLDNFTVPLRPMLGGLAVAPGFGSAPMSTGDTGAFGGNMDFNEVIEGNTVYLPVFQPGALLYLGDAHALQGDGETSQFALETSMDVEFRVEVRHGTAINMPRVESPTQIMVLGQAGSLDDALRNATTGLTRWLRLDYGLSLSEGAQVLGSSVHYDIANLAGRSVGVAARLDKARLAGMPRLMP